MRILVTGGCGFIGSHIVDTLIGLGHSVAVLDDLSSGKLENLNKSAEFCEMDVRSGGLASLFDRLKPDAVFHEAAQISVSRSVNDPQFDADVNLLGTVNVLEYCKAHGAKLVFASSAAVYGAPEYLGIDEAHPTKPMSPYGLSKLAAEGYIRLYSELFGLDYTILRYANVYGPRQDAKGEGGVVAIFADRAKKGIAPTIFGDGRQSRDFIHVLDVAAANAAALTLGSRETVNVGSGSAVTISALCSMMSRLEPNIAAERQGDIRHSYFDNAKMRQVLGFTPKYDLQAGLDDLMQAQL